MKICLIEDELVYNKNLVAWNYVFIDFYAIFSEVLVS